MSSLPTASGGAVLRASDGNLTAIDGLMPAEKRSKLAEDANLVEEQAGAQFAGVAPHDEEMLLQPTPLFRRNFADAGFAADFRGQEGSDQYVRQHLNGVCVVGLAHGHAILQQGKTVEAVEFTLKDGGKTPKGKGKKNAHFLVADTKVCEVRCTDGTKYTIRSMVDGILYEVNANLVVQPQLLTEHPNSEGYVLIVQPRRSRNAAAASHLVDEQTYNRLVAARLSPVEHLGLADVDDAGAAACMLFIGVSTGGSFINRLFPRWAAHLGHRLPARARLQLIDLPVGVGRARMRAVLQAALADTSVRGALITTHKIAAFEAGRALFDNLDGSAHALGEVSCATRTAAGGLAGEAADAVCVRRALALAAPEAHFAARPTAQALVLGAGGAGVALAQCLLQRQYHRPAAIILTDVDEGRLEAARRHLGGLAAAAGLDLRLVLVSGGGDSGCEEEGATMTSALLASLLPGSLVVNATGLGKDRPGSPVPEGGVFPLDALVWELNYRGERLFLQQARAQQDRQQLTVTDGWDYFLHGWSYVMSRVFAFCLDDNMFAGLQAVANELREEEEEGLFTNPSDVPGAV